MKRAAAAVLLALRDLPVERGASMPRDQVDELVEQLKADGLVTVVTSATSDQRVHAVSIRGHEWLADHAEVAC